MSKVISPVEAKKIMDNDENIVVVDVREKEELVEGYIENSLLIPLSSFEGEAEKKLTDKKKTTLVYCRSGRRSAMACEILDRLGYENVYDFGGIISWPFEKII